MIKIKVERKNTKHEQSKHGPLRTVEVEKASVRNMEKSFDNSVINNDFKISVKLRNTKRVFTSDSICSLVIWLLGRNYGNRVQILKTVSLQKS